MPRKDDIGTLLNLPEAVPHVEIVDVPSYGNEFEKLIDVPQHVLLDEYGIPRDHDPAHFSADGYGLVAHGMAGRGEKGNIVVIGVLAVEGRKGTPGKRRLDAKNWRLIRAVIGRKRRIESEL